ncbi:traf2 and NCK-interacting protein kinase isoform X1 [Bactrocera neohumeralis]|uniref:traf2 and NCK-interacting protein kinase isoform X1 n=2 Tax=Bactrocera neohumeralis TaxID=98809 RepID=UPI0021653E66|nr:traf2 and NCK-interacting protein kinase isoform X1 [Bactrocera neohumeralis]XP_050318322.1 traf2 and NCK-interacting protein kinase isoform X1 [Bactrocera neohumeralis]XP_050318323.1 traf2 and NCK-interacting protein kinase isoform X1 [Bactrocera neohumeralis]
MQLLWSNMYPQSELDNYKLQVDLLQEKLKQSEENRQQLQKELQQILQRRSEHDKSVRTKIRQKYQSFLDEQERRNERNKMLMQMIERIDQQTTALSARSERLKMMKLQYERYFAKLMQTQPVRCTPNAVPTARLSAEATPITAMTASTQIPVLLPAMSAHAPTTAPPIGTLSGLKSEVTTTTPVSAIPTLQPGLTHIEAMTEAQPAALTPRMWTFAMATPTPAGLLLSGAPTASMTAGTLQTAATPFEFLQYPFGYGPVIQQHTLQQQASYANVTPTDPSMAFANRRDVPQASNADLTERKYSVPNEYELTDDMVSTAEAATSTEFPSIGDKSVGEMANKQTETMPYSMDRMVDTGEMEGYEYSPATSQEKPTHITSTQILEKLSRNESDNTIPMKAPVGNPVFKEPNSALNEVNTNLSAVKLENADIMDKPPTEPTNNSQDQKMGSRPSYIFEDDHHSTTSEDALKKGNTIKLSTAEEHRRKIAEIEQRYGTIDTEGNNDYAYRNMNPESNETGFGFKRFSEIVNPKMESNAEQLQPTNENLDNQSWQSHTGSVENASMAPTTSMSSSSKPLSSSKIDNIENAIYGELVNNQLPEPEVTPTRTAAQGFFTELLEQQKTPLENNQLQEPTAQEQEYTTNLSGNIGSSDTGELKPETPISEATDPQNQATYGTYNTEIQQPTNTFNAENAYGTAEATNNYAEYPVEQKIEAGSTDTTDQLQQPVYSQQDYENYDATQYGNYDPNAYPGYIYDEATGQYVVDPQYTANDASNAEALYTTQDYTEPQEQQQQNPVQGDNYTHEDSNNSTAAPAATEQTLDATPTPIEPYPPAAAVEPSVAAAVPSAPNVVKPTSILSTAEKHAMQSDAQKKKKRVIFVDSSETDDSSSAKAPAASATNAGNESDFDFSSGAETSVG